MQYGSKKKFNYKLRGIRSWGREIVKPYPYGSGETIPKKYIQFWATDYKDDCAKLEWIQRTAKQLLNGWIYEER